MHLLILLLLIWQLGFLSCTEQIIKSYNCSSYFSRVLAQQNLDELIRKTAEKNCPEGLRFEMTGFEWHDIMCYVEYQLQASEEEMKMDPVCYSSYQNMFMYAVETFWGTPWGCDDSQVQIYLTKYYGVWRSIPSVATVSEIIAVRGLCSHPFLPSDAAFDAFCGMTEFGGYLWKGTEEDDCFIEELNVATDEAMDLVRRELKGPVKCLALYLMIWQRIVEEMDPNKTILEYTQRVTAVLDKWSISCLPMEHVFGYYFLKRFFSLSEIIADAIIIMSEGVAFNLEPKWLDKFSVSEEIRSEYDLSIMSCKWEE